MTAATSADCKTRQIAINGRPATAGVVVPSAKCFSSVGGAHVIIRYADGEYAAIIAATDLDEAAEILASLPADCRA